MKYKFITSCAKIGAYGFPDYFEYDSVGTSS